MPDQRNLFLQVEGLDRLNSILSNISSGFKPYMVAAMRNNLVMLVDEAKRKKAGSFQNRTGNLRRSIQIQGAITATRGVMGTDQKYARYVEEGTQPYVMYPRNKKALFWPGAAHPMRFVNRPGNKAYPYMEPALKAVAPRILQTYADMFQTLAKGGAI